MKTSSKKNNNKLSAKLLTLQNPPQNKVNF